MLRRFERLDDGARALSASRSVTGLLVGLRDRGRRALGAARGLGGAGRGRRHRPVDVCSTPRSSWRCSGAAARALPFGILFVKLLAFLGLGWLVFAASETCRPDPLGFAVGVTCLPVAAVWEAMRARRTTDGASRIHLAARPCRRPGAHRHRAVLVALLLRRLRAARPAQARRHRGRARPGRRRHARATSPRSFVEAISGLAEGVIGHHSERYVPLLAAFFVFILVANLIGLVPGFVPPTSNFNITFGARRGLVPRLQLLRHDASTASAVPEALPRAGAPPRAAHARASSSSATASGRSRSASVSSPTCSPTTRW